jgi:putative NAD(P)H nitroreductase
MEFATVVRNRQSVRAFDPSYTLHDDQLRALFDLAILSPSSFNLQHWRFVVVRDATRKALLRHAAHGQAHVSDASAVIVACGRMDAHLQPTHRSAAETDAERARRTRIERLYGNSAQLQRDEATRSASLACMTLMLAAESIGLATCPLIGFDVQEVCDIVGLDALQIPVMLVAIGKAAAGSGSRKPRLPLDTVVRLETLDGTGLRADDSHDDLWELVGASDEAGQPEVI